MSRLVSGCAAQIQAQERGINSELPDLFMSWCKRGMDRGWGDDDNAGLIRVLRDKALKSVRPWSLRRDVVASDIAALDDRTQSAPKLDIPSSRLFIWPMTTTRQIERRLGDWMRVRLPGWAAELVMFLLKMGWSALFGLSLLVAIIGTKPDLVRRHAALPV